MKHDRHQTFGIVDRGETSVTLASGCGPEWSKSGPDVGAGWEIPIGSSARTLIIGGPDNGEPLRKIAYAVQAHPLEPISFDTAPKRIADLVRIDLILMDCRTDKPQWKDALAIAQDRVKADRAHLIIIAELEIIDRIDAIVGTDAHVTLLCSPSAMELGMAIRTALSMNSSRPVLRDVNTPDGADLAALSDELRQLRAIVELLAQDRQLEGNGAGRFHAPARDFRPMPEMHPVPTRQTELKAAQVRALIRARRLREQLLPGDLFADPAWDIMLDLMAAELEGHRVSVSSLCIAAAVPPTTALRWIKLLTERGLLERRADNADGRRVFIALSVEGYRAVERWFQSSRALLMEVAG